MDPEVEGGNNRVGKLVFLGRNPSEVEDWKKVVRAFFLSADPGSHHHAPTPTKIHGYAHVPALRLACSGMRGSRNFRQEGVQVHLTTFFFSPQFILQILHFPRFQRGSNFSRGGGGGGGERSNSLFPCNLWFPKGGGVRTPCPPPLWIRPCRALKLFPRVMGFFVYAILRQTAQARL